MEDTVDQSSNEMLHIVMRRQELQNRLFVLQEMQEFLKSKSLTGTVSEEDEQGLSELEKIKTELQLLSQRESNLLTTKGLVIQESSKCKNITTDHQNRVCVLPTARHSVSRGSSEEVVEVKDLSFSPATVQCPVCLQQVTTKVHRRVGPTTFLLCFLSVMLGCVGGCCLLPFCMNYFKDVSHRCPSCQAEISTVHRI
ncbi:uncharacterized protein LOC143510701 [Brachyhypopomus gauderio]|uniref:uncharacterized protein LOC143510701 n=1 Tax=Brachyhypopomus gauderio TaxID=698409 RepID=UPI0040428189